MSNGTVVCLNCGQVIRYQTVKPAKCPKCGEPIDDDEGN